VKRNLMELEFWSHGKESQLIKKEKELKKEYLDT
jgi:hypothetical protein